MYQNEKVKKKKPTKSFDRKCEYELSRSHYSPVLTAQAALGLAY